MKQIVEMLAPEKPVNATNWKLPSHASGCELWQHTIVSHCEKLPTEVAEPGEGRHLKNRLLASIQNL